jgi:hypothetical protein
MNGSYIIASNRQPTADHCAQSASAPNRIAAQGRKLNQFAKET